MVHTTHETCSFDCNPVDAISSLTVQIAETFGVLPEQQRLLFRGKQLTPCFSFTDYDIHDGARVHLVLELTGGGIRDTLMRSDPMITENSDNESWQGDEPIFGGDLEMDAPPCTPQLPSEDEPWQTDEPIFGGELEMDAPPRTPQPASKDEEAPSAQPLLGDSSEDDGCVWTPAPASEAESSENGLPGPSTYTQQISDTSGKSTIRSQHAIASRSV